MRARHVQILAMIAVGSIPWAAGCSTVRETGRQRILLTSSGQEQKLGLEAYQEVLAKEQRSSDTRMIGIVERVGQRIAAVAEQPDFQWEFALIESPQVNAFCLPGGKIAVYTGILPVMKNEAGLAVVMGHEVAHATARHGGERMSQHMTVEVIEQVLSYGLNEVAPAARSGAMQAFGLGTQVGVLLPYSRAHESEADEIGLIYAARAGYDPRESVELWKRMAEAGGSKPPEFLSTHPHEENRIKKLQEQIPAALDIYNAAPQQYGLGEQW